MVFGLHNEREDLPARICEEQSAHEQFVKEMKIPIQSDPNNYHYIKNG